MSGSLTHSPSRILQQLLIDLGVATAPADGGSWPVYHGQEPDTPDNCVSVFVTAGIKQGRTHIDGEVYEIPGYMIRVRAQNEDEGWTEANAICAGDDGLDKNSTRSTVTVGSTDYLVCAVHRTSGPIHLGKESGTKRDLFTINGTMSLRQTS